MFRLWSWDGTYKLFSLGYVLEVFGVVDIIGAFHPVAFMISSSEDEGDFMHFFDGIRDLATTINVEYKVEFLMQDACRASFNAARISFPNAVVLMCYFHVVHKKCSDY